MKTSTAMRRCLLLAPLMLALAVMPLALPASGHRYGSTNSSTDDHANNDQYYWPSSWNGYRIYLSPAHHWQGWKYGCDGYVEDLHMSDLAYEAAQRAGANLQSRGYYVRVGSADPDDNTRRSNAWGSDRHIALHSNGSTSDGSTCSGQTGGTITFNYYGSSPGSFLAQELLDKLAPVSPGSHTDYRDPCTCLYELNNTTMPAAYVETGFHDYQPDKNWLVSDLDNIAYRIGWAVDVHLGYP